MGNGGASAGKLAELVAAALPSISAEVLRLSHSCRVANVKYIKTAVFINSFPFLQCGATPKAERAPVINLECGQSINPRKENILK
jgi:hypothetical protein